MKRITSLVTFMCSLLFFASSANAQFVITGSWDYLGWDTFTSESEIFRSGGGDYMYCRDQYDGGADVIELWEYDPESYNDYVGSRNVNPGDCETFRNIGSFTDGTDGQAEFFLKKSGRRYANVYFYD